MTDVFTQAKRSEVMSRIRGKGNAATEIRLVKLLKEQGITGWRRHLSLRFKVNDSTFKVKPDFIFRKLKLAVFVDGEFWHGHPTRANIPEGNRAFWIKKIEGNKARDRLVNRTLRTQGWTVIRVWQSDIMKPETLKKLLAAHPKSKGRN